jgi:hypothetical protein
MVAHVSNPSCTVVGNRRSTEVQGHLGQNRKTLSEKQAKSKRTGGVAQVVECADFSLQN